MEKAEFDKFADEYQTMLSSSVSASGEGPAYFAEYKIFDIRKELHAVTPDNLRILDFGAGVGSSIQYILKYFTNAKLACIDVSSRSLEIARTRFPGVAEYRHFDGLRIPFADMSFDVAYAMCVFHHIDRKIHIGLFEELKRVLKPGGSLFIFEHNPRNPLTRRVVRDCPFDQDANLIDANELSSRILKAGFESTKICYRIFFPNSLKWLRPLESKMKSIPIGAQYYIMATK